MHMEINNEGDRPEKIAGWAWQYCTAIVSVLA